MPLPKQTRFARRINFLLNPFVYCVFKDEQQESKSMWRHAKQGRLFKRTTHEPAAGQGDLFPLIETKELRKTATADRNAVAAHPDLQALVMELELLGFSPFAIAEGLSLKANEVRQRGQNQLIGVRCLDDDSWHFGYVRNWEPQVLTASKRTDHTEISRRRFAETEPATVEPTSRLYRLSKDGVSNTLRAGTDSARGAFTSPRPIHYEKPRCITVREMARLHGFPDWFRFHETKWHGARQIGNAFPPPFARTVAASIIQALAIEPTRPETPIDLGDLDLLRMDMSHASEYWGVPNPIARRNRKSGARYRIPQQ